MLVGEVDIERLSLLHGTEPAADVTLLLSPNPTAAHMECIGSNPIGRLLLFSVAESDEREESDAVWVLL